MKTYKSTVPELRLKRVPTELKKAKIKSSKDAEQFARQFYFDDLTIYESFFIILLNNANNTIGYVKISQGGVGGTVADPQLIAKYCIESLCKGIILVHNHPSGNLKVSTHDKQVTKRIKETLQIFDCMMLDHIIITENDYVSFIDNDINIYES